MSRTNKRLALFMGLAVLFLVALMGRTFYVQVIAAPALEEKAEGQSVRTVTLEAPRGVIYDRNGQILAISRATASVYANPQQIEDADEAMVAAKLAPVLGLEQTELLGKLSGNSSFRYLVRRIDEATGAKVKGLELEGIGVCTESKRVYPKGELAPQLLGFVGGDEYTGLAGLELQYDALLSGEPGESQVVSDLQGNRLSTVSMKEAVPGEPLHLTIDAEIQFETERVLAHTVEEFGAKKACAVVIEPATGEILAMANTPVFDTNDYAASSVVESDRRNMVVTDQYEPGSTFKMVSVAAALEEGEVTPDTVFRLGRTITVYDRVVHEAHDETTPEMRELTVTQILSKSSNVGAVTLGMAVGKSKLVDRILKFGFTQKLGIDFPSEAAGQMLPAEKWSGTTIANVPMGQGIAVSPLQLAAAYAAIANDGMMVQPHLARGRAKPWIRQVVSKTVAAQLRRMLTVTVEDGTGRLAAVDGYSVAGKTGTAQKVKEEGGYYDDKFVASFVGMVPVGAPRLVILVTVDEPATQHYGSAVAAPAFAEIADFALKRLGVAPDATD
ncbi:MAG: penicillin-binding protein 2 [Thermoleophilia bacterium]|nr:penicillin-binding protein 2 [Thermoleophilia bacterium]